MQAKKNIHWTSIVKALIKEGNIGTHAKLVDALRKRGYSTNQSKISRLLRQLPIMKVRNAQGQLVYTLPQEPLPPSSNTPLTQLIMEIVTNETLIAVRTSPGSGPLIARVLDHHPKDSQILATLAGDDTVFVMPKSIHHLNKTLEEIKYLLAGFVTNTLLE